MEYKSKSLLEYINNNVIGNNCTFVGPFGRRKILYCDYTASAKPLQCIEDYIQNHVLPMYANTHTTTCATALQTTYFRQEARDIVRNSVHATEHDAVIFTANGVTGAIHKLINALDLKKPPIIFCGPYEHHSNLLPWREISAHVVRITESRTGINTKHLELALSIWSGSGFPLIGCFSAASNVTGLVCDTESITMLLHKYGALSVWDYATAAPYVAIDMHPYVKNGDASKDAIFISPHKFVGGVGTPGVLVASKDLFKNPIPSDYGGGSVFFVSAKSHTYLQDQELREEGGTPDIVGSIRCGLAFKLKNDVGCDNIMEIENAVFKKVSKSWIQSRNIVLIGADGIDQNRLAIFSFLIRHAESGLFLHYSFITALLNDLFGIQARGGCMCAGPYAQDLLGISGEFAEKFEAILTEDSRLDRRHLRRFREYSKYEVLRPGFTRITIPYFFNECQVDFIIDAVLLLSDIAWILLPEYSFDPDTGEWRNKWQKLSQNRKWLGHFNFKEDTVSETVVGMTFEESLVEANRICENVKKTSYNNLTYHSDLFESAASELLWFLTPSEAYLWRLSRQPVRMLPFSVRRSVTELTDEEIQRSVAIPPFILRKIEELSGHDSGSLSNQHIVQKEFNNGQYAFRQHGMVSDMGAKSIMDSATMPQQCQLAASSLINNLSVKNNGGFVNPPKRLMKFTLQAINEFNMIKNGDRVLVCLSGGKDSMSLLHVLKQYQFIARKSGLEFKLGAVTVDPKSASYDPSSLKPYLASLGLPYFFEEQGILDKALSLPELTSICAFCSRMKRGRLYHCARREGWNILALGQHLDDLAESFMMSFFQNGLLRTMKANYSVAEGDLRVIRPFVYVRERDTRKFAEDSRMPIVPENCPACFEAPKERHRMKQLLASLEIIHPKLFYSVKEALRPLMAVDRFGLKGILNDSKDN